ncbi:hypothetical protein Agub_g15403 [Astrephomene gubernaculifera]|uniref:non-specific serine/threonine protein kinase n=1 Tax=Astrephomene gubernaculifera TaxID=47775 RepID=A0AAD3E6V1_9CHLO|nr:hypothetical protein Agub_g15403 [Astrephomene gubernaculifera]
MDNHSLRLASMPNLSPAGAAPVRAPLAREVIDEEAEMQPTFPEYGRSNSAEAQEARAHLLGVQQQAWDRCSSADGMDPAVARQLASAVEDKLKLAPILAKRLERVSHSSGSGSFSSRQSASSMTYTLNPSGPSGRPQRLVPTSDYSKLNFLVTSLEGVKGERNLKVEGSARLPQVIPRDPSGSPTTCSRGGNSHNFDEAKRQVDRDLRVFLDDVRELYAQIGDREGADVPIVLEVIASIMDIAEECLETPVEDFKLTITDIVDNIEEERSSCQQRTIRALYTRLLFILTRCSRLLITEQQHLFATEPRNRRRHSQVFGPGFATKTEKELGLHLPCPPLNQACDSAAIAPNNDDEPVFRSHTMPVKAMYNMVQRLKREGPIAPAGGWAEPQQLSRIESELPDSPADRNQQSDAPPFHHHSQSSDLDGLGMGSDGSTTSLSKKKKGFFGKLSKGIKNLTDGFKRKSSNVKDKDGADAMSRPHSELSQQPQHVRFRLSSDQPQKSPASPASSMRSPKPLTDGGEGSETPRRQDVPRTVRFQEAPVHIIGDSDEGSPMGPRSCADGSVSEDGDSGKRAKLMVQTERSALDDGRTSHSPQASSELEALGGGRAKLYRRASVDLFAMGLCTGGVDPPMSPEGLPPEDLTVICSICEEAWLSTHLEEHSIHCAVLRTLSGNGLSVDAQLTTIANVLEEWLETPLAFPALGPAPSQYHVKNQLIKLIRAARNSAALQPDGSKVPTTRCFSIQGELNDMLEAAAQSDKLAIVTQTYAHRIMRLISEKVNLLAEPFGGHRVRTGGGSDAGDSGTSTPRSMPGMSIEEFEIIKPISRGAFGRVYLARKLATGDLFAIKVMKKRDLIRKNMVESVTNERNILAMAQNPFVVRFYYSFTSRENLYIVMEYINGGDCFSLLRKFGALDEEVARQYIAETVLALEYCHAQGIIHRDLKPDNLLINAQGHVKLTDFGLSCVGVIDRTDNLNSSQPMDTDGPEHEAEAGWGQAADASGEYSGSGGGVSAGEPMDASKPEDGPSMQDFGPQGGARTSAPGQCAAASSLGMPPRPFVQHQRIVAPEHECRRAVGTPDYLAPELLLGTGHGPEVDWWALGAILYEFVTGTPPFNADTPEDIFDNILDRRITWPEDEEDMSCECRDLIDKLLHPNPLKRLGHRGAGEVKLHPWFEGLDWTSLVRNKAAFIPAVEDETDTSYFESKHVSQRSMAEDLDKLRTSAQAGLNERSSAQAGPGSGLSGLGAGSGPSGGQPGGGRTQVDRLKDQYHREGSGLRSTGSSASHGSSHVSRTSCTGNLPGLSHLPCSQSCGAGGVPDPMEGVHLPRMSSSPNSTGPSDSGLPPPPSCSHGRSSANQAMLCGSVLNPRNSGGSSCCGAAAAAGAAGLRSSNYGARNSASGVPACGSDAAGVGVMSERPSPASAGAAGGGGVTPAGVSGWGDGAEADCLGGIPDPYATYVDGYDEDGEVEGDEEVQDGEGAEGDAGHTPLEESPTGSGEDAVELGVDHDPFGNFSFTNFTGLSAANMEKIQKLREHFNRRTSYSGPTN